MSTLTKKQIIGQIGELSEKLGKDFTEDFFQQKSKKELEKVLQALKREAYWHNSSKSDSEFAALDGCSMRQRNKGAIAELLRNGRLGSF